MVAGAVGAAVAEVVVVADRTMTRAVARDMEQLWEPATPQEKGKQAKKW